MRRLPILSTDKHDDLVIAFCFGLLTVQFAAAWNDACSTLKVISDRSGAKVWEMAFARLKMDDEGAKPSAVTADHQRPEKFSITNFADEIWGIAGQDLTFRLRSLCDAVFSFRFVL